MIDLNNIPVEPTVTILNPDGSELITTNNVTTFTWIRLEIKNKKLSGYKVRTNDGELWEIRSNGKIEAWPENMTCSIFDKLFVDLI